MSDLDVKVETVSYGRREQGKSWLATLRFAIPVICLLVILYWFGRGHGLKARLLSKVWTFHPWITGTRPESGRHLAIGYWL